VLERVVAVGCALRPVGQPEMGIRRALDVTIAAGQNVAALQRAQTLEAVSVALGCDHRLLG